LALAITVTGSLSIGGSAVAKETPELRPAEVSLAVLPAEARSTEQLIRAGGPFPHAKDGTVFGNRERLLPSQARGYYREYTVSTPGARDRGARRIVCGGTRPARPDGCFYTADHYTSFSRIVP
jgi:ribonuclease T1